MIKKGHRDYEYMLFFTVSWIVLLLALFSGCLYTNISKSQGSKTLDTEITNL